MNYLNSYLRSKLDLSHIGFIRREKESNYFCTPVLSKVIGWAGVDGIHFCTTKGFDEIIFAISPENLPGEYVHPVARNFEDFPINLTGLYVSPDLADVVSNDCNKNNDENIQYDTNTNHGTQRRYPAAACRFDPAL